jgi:hypothetical protein
MGVRRLGNDAQQGERHGQSGDDLLSGSARMHRFGLYSGLAARTTPDGGEPSIRMVPATGRKFPACV